MKKLITIIVIILIFFPMLIYMNPFIWGMRRQPHYRPSSKTSALLSELNNKYKMDMSVGEVIDTLWYFRDLEHHKITKLENFELNMLDENEKNVNLDSVKSYVKEFNKEFEHKKYFDSIKITKNYDSLIYKTKMR
ncbi:hypothetical protein LUD75_09290 [Epilithonimonas sp. JDS]|uniref:hypothetical protein n=1 Tax=Epilithonimonas sp. JDS TaxID=2902797 RepID=UPI001E2AC5CF|nr:hypothetical protein [Epilithonimonas sp. JDS]MCD9854898.1 hypothetical protein [Epilithonimonas sp. JDS]